MWAYSLLLLGATMSLSSPLPQLKIVPAAQVRRVPGIIVYEKTTKLIFHVDMGHIFHEIRLNSTTGNNTMRGIILGDIQDDVLLDLRSTDPHRAPNNSRQRRQIGVALAFAGGYAVHSLFSTISSRLFGSNQEVLEYIHELRNSVGEAQRELIVTEHKTMQFSENVQKFLMQLENKTKSEFEDIMELMRLKIFRDWLWESRSACTARTIPNKLISHLDLTVRLGNLEGKLRKVNGTLAIPLTDLYSYYKLPLVDCIFTETGIVVSINVPIRGIHNKWKLYEISHTKFAFKEQTCHIYPTDSNYVAKSSEKSVVITSSMMPHCLINQFPLCLVPEYTRDSSESLGCALGLLEDRSIAELQKMCAFRCTSNQEIVIQEHSESSITLTNAQAVQIDCPDHQKEFHFEKLGAVHLEMTCGCNVLVDYKLTLRPPLFCKDSFSRTVTVVRITPNLWSRLESASGYLTKTYIDHNNETLNEEWPQLIPVLNLTTPTFSPIQNESFYEHVSYTDVWLVAISVVVLFQTIALLYTCTVVRA